MIINNAFYIQGSCEVSHRHFKRQKTSLTSKQIKRH